MAEGGLSKHYHLRFDPKVGMGVFAIFRIPCACVACTIHHTFSHIGVKHQYYPEHDTLCLSIFFP